jgi:hypothetical protein
MRIDGQTEDTIHLIGAFHDYVNAMSNSKLQYIHYYWKCPYSCTLNIYKYELINEDS